MKQDVAFKAGDVMMSGNYWDTMRDGVQIAIDGLNDIASQVEAHQRNGKYKAEEMLDRINGQAREIRNILEAVLPPF